MVGVVVGSSGAHPICWFTHQSELEIQSGAPLEVAGTQSLEPLPGACSGLHEHRSRVRSCGQELNTGIQVWDVAISTDL